MSASTTTRPNREQEKAQARQTIADILALGRRRLAGSDTERRAHEYLDAQFQKLGLATELQPFWTDQSLYRNLMLHFGLALLATWLAFDQPFWAMCLHLLVGYSYVQDSTKRKYILRKLHGKAASQNLLARRQPVNNPDLRIVLLAHADAAFTGKMFDPELIRASTKREFPPQLQFLKKPLLTAVGSVFVLAAIDFWIWTDELTTFKTFLLLAASIPSTITFVLNFDVVRRNEVVPGANDNLSGCAALLLLAERQKNKIPGNVEIVYGVTGAEEVSLIGATALRDNMEQQWKRSNTVVVAVDTLCGGNLQILHDGEVVKLNLPYRLAQAVQKAAAKIEGLGQVPIFEVPTGGTDAVPFMYAGYEGLAIGCVDPEIGAPRNYHLPSDTLENVDFNQVLLAVDLIEGFVDEVIADRIKPQPKLPA